ncbi:MAG TPA: FAD-binding oxidoreductase [Chryseosolibacter sp.]|nr:FAD-binding oxidoreductase [Chryseosolibacter sp.]
MDHQVRILSKTPLNHNVIQFRLEKPENYSFTAGQAIELTVEEPMKYGPGPFTFTALDSKPYLELMIKIYEDHQGLTSALGKRKEGETVTIGDPWDSFVNKGPGVFIAGGAGITPFVALLRRMKVDGNIGKSQLLFFNKTHQDIFLREELTDLLGARYQNILTREDNGSPKGKLDETVLCRYVTDFSQPFYICGPPGFIETAQLLLAKLGAKEETVNVSF